jgi:hypothetical protein
MVPKKLWSEVHRAINFKPNTADLPLQSLNSGMKIPVDRSPLSLFILKLRAQTIATAHR